LTDCCRNLRVDGTGGRSQRAASGGCCGCRLRDQDGCVDNVVIGVVIRCFKCVVDGVVGVTMLPRRGAELDRRKTTPLCFLKEHFEGRIRLGGGGFPRVKFLEGEDV
jgi:hypothetical protein